MFCKGISDVTCLAASRSLVEVNLATSGVTSDGIKGLEEIPTLRKVNLSQCKGIFDERSLLTRHVAVALTGTLVALGGQSN
jgi:hypothetical protein